MTEPTHQQTDRRADPLTDPLTDPAAEPVARRAAEPDGSPSAASAGPFDPGPLRDVHAAPAGGRWTLVYREHFAHSPEAVWSALTDPEQLPAWAPYTADRDLGRVGPVTLIMIDGDERQQIPGAVTVVEPTAVLELDWGGQLLRWELTAVDGGTDLELQHTIDNRDQLSAMAAGWHLCLLAADAKLRRQPIGPVADRAALDYGWTDLERRYAERLGAEPTALTPQQPGQRS